MRLSANLQRSKKCHDEKRWKGSTRLPRGWYCGQAKKITTMQVVEVLDGGWYRLGCSQGILDIHYQAADLEPVEAEYSELEDIPETTISLTAVIRGQSISDESSSCNCRTNCSTRRCPCRRADNVCSLNCHHRNNDCINNWYILLLYT